MKHGESQTRSMGLRGVCSQEGPTGSYWVSSFLLTHVSTCFQNGCSNSKLHIHTRGKIISGVAILKDFNGTSWPGIFSTISFGEDHVAAPEQISEDKNWWHILMDSSLFFYTKLHGEVDSIAFIGLQ